MYKVKKALILAAGFGSRLEPITLTTPKPLIDVNGRIIIETIIEGLISNDIEEIYIIVGYMKEKFLYLKDKYKNVSFIENEYYSFSNNISSIYCAREYIPESIIIEGDLVIYNNQILNSSFDKSGYNAIYMPDKKCTEWGLEVVDNTIKKCDKSGGEHDWQLIGISRWNKEDGEKLKEDIKKEFEKDTKSNMYWDDVALSKCLKGYDLGIFEMQRSDVIEIDTYDELKKIDQKYK